MRLRPIAAVVLLLLVAAAGVVVVQQLTRPAAREPIAPIDLEPAVKAGESAEDDGGARKQRRRRVGGERRDFAPSPAATPTPDARGAPDAPPPQIEVPTPPAGDTDDDGGDG